ncbi:hypothetical protein [Bacillus mobilis]|uniref:hypothetical protein n=1 Tax=Bacillus mobilis TaxID=2026190 RepID=UPI0036A42AC0
MFQVELFKVWQEEKKEGFLTFGILSTEPKYESVDYVIEHCVGRELIIYSSESDLNRAYDNAIERLKEDYNKVLIGWKDEGHEMIFA